MSAGASAKTGYREYAGASPHTDALWVHAPGERLEAMIAADGCVDLIVRVGSNGALSAFLHSPSAHAHRAVVERGESLFGVRLRPGYGMPLLARQAELAQLGRERFQAGAQLYGLEELVAEAIDDGGRPPALVREFLAFATETRGTARIGDSLRTPFCERRLQREAKRWLGVTPKAYLRIERAFAARSALCEGKPLADVAVDLCFADQAHLTRELRALLGMTPTQVRSVGFLQDGADRRS